MRKMLTVVGVVAGVAAGLPGSVASAAPADCVPAVVSVDDVGRYEGTGSGGGTFELIVTVTAAAGCEPTGSVDYATEYGTAGAGDILATSGTLTWTADASSRTVAVPVLADSAIEADEKFTLRLSDPVGLTVPDTTAIGTLVDDDASPPVFDADGKICWRQAGTCPVRISSRQPLAAPVTLRYQTIGEAASYVPVADGVLTIPAGTGSATVSIRLLSGTWPTERFTLELHTPSSGTVATPHTEITIQS